jgi:hypothetical protein
MVRAILVPAHHVDEVLSVDAGTNMRGLIEVGSCGTPIRLTLSAHLLMKLGRMATKAASEMMAQEQNNIVAFAKPKRRRAT